MFGWAGRRQVPRHAVRAGGGVWRLHAEPRTGGRGGERLVQGLRSVVGWRELSIAADLPVARRPRSGIGFAAAVRAPAVRHILVGSCCLGAFGLLAAQFVVGFPLEGWLHRTITHMAEEDAARGNKDVKAASMAAAMFGVERTPWAWLSFAVDLAAVGVVAAEWAVRRGEAGPGPPPGSSTRFGRPSQSPPLPWCFWRSRHGALRARLPCYGPPPPATACAVEGLPQSSLTGRGLSASPVAPLPCRAYRFRPIRALKAPGRPASRFRRSDAPAGR